MFILGTYLTDEISARRQKAEEMTAEERSLPLEMDGMLWSNQLQCVQLISWSRVDVRCWRTWLLIIRSSVLILENRSASSAFPSFGRRRWVGPISNDSSEVIWQKLSTSHTASCRLSKSLQRMLLWFISPPTLHSPSLLPLPLHGLLWPWSLFLRNNCHQVLCHTCVI